MNRGIALLYAPVVPAPQDTALRISQAGADGDAALGQPDPCIFYRHLEQ